MLFPQKKGPGWSKRLTCFSSSIFLDGIVARKLPISDIFVYISRNPSSKIMGDAFNPIGYLLSKFKSFDTLFVLLQAFI